MVIKYLKLYVTLKENVSVRADSFFFFSCASKGVLDCKEEKKLPEKLEQK